MPAMAGAGASSKTGVKKGGANWLVVMVFCAVAFFIGIVNAPFMADYLSFLPNPMRDEVTKLKTEIQVANKTINDMRSMGADKDDGPKITQDQLNQLIKDIESKTGELGNIQAQLDATRATMDGQQSELDNVERDLRERNDELISAREFLEELRNATAIVSARQSGFIPEVARFTGQVGGL